MAQLTKADVAALAADPSLSNRTDAMLRVAEVFAEGRLSEAERTVATSIINLVLPEAELLVRRRLSEYLKRAPGLDPDLARRMAYDVIEVAEPILAECLALSDDDLVQIVENCSIAHARSVARRPMLKEAVATALIKTDDEVCVARVASNDNAEVGLIGYHRILDHFAENQQVVDLLTQRRALPMAVAERLTAVVSGRALERLISRYDLPAHRVSQLIHHGREHVLLTGFASEQRAEDTRSLIQRLAQNGLLSSSIIVRALCLGNFTFFMPALALKAQVPVGNVRTLIADEGNQGAEKLFERCGLDARHRPLFIKLVAMSRSVRSRRFGFAPEGWIEAVNLALDEILGGRDGDQSFEQRVSEALIRLENDSRIGGGAPIAAERRAIAG